MAQAESVAGGGGTKPPADDDEDPPSAAASPGAAPAAAIAATSTALAANSSSDVELEAAALAVDRASAALRADVVARLLEWKRRADEQQRALEEAGARAAAEQAALQQQLADLRGCNTLQREALRRMGEALFRAARWRRQHTLGCVAWRAWREHARRQRRLEVQRQAAARHYDVGKLQRRVLAAWRLAAAAAQRAKAKSQAGAAAEAERQRLEIAAVVAQQAQRLAEVEATLSAALAARAELEQGMRRAFMRGVCALNIEAMALLKADAEDGTTALSQQPQQLQQPPGVTSGTDAAREQEQLLRQKAACAGALPAAPSASPPPGPLTEQWTLAAGFHQVASTAGAAASGLAALLGMPENWQRQAGDKVTAAGCSAIAAAAPVGSTCHGTGGREHLQPAAERPQPLVSLAPTQPVHPVVLLPAGHPGTAVRHPGGHIADSTPPRPAKQLPPVPCSLPSNVPANIASMLAGTGRSIGGASPLRPTTAPARRQHPVAALAAPVAAGPTLLQVTRRSMAGQQRGSGGPARADAQPLVVRGAVTAGREAQAMQARWNF